MSSPKRIAYLSTVSHVGPFGGSNSGCFLHKIVVGKATSTAVITVYDGQDNTGTVVATIDGGTLATHHFDGAWLKNGLYVAQTTAAADVSVVYE